MFNFVLKIGYNCNLQKNIDKIVVLIQIIFSETVNNYINYNIYIYYYQVNQHFNIVLI